MSSSSSSRNTDRNKNTQMSKSLTYLLRHGAPKEKLSIRSDGFVPLSQIMAKPKFRSMTFDQVKDIVDTCNKQRFKLVQFTTQNTKGEDVTEWYIRANQGHSFPVPDLELQSISCPTEAPVCVHGTYKKSWDSIKKSGLSRMNRQHIHFAIGVPADKAVISGMRTTSEILIYANVQKMLQDGIALYKSENSVLLSPGKGDTGIIPVEYFEKVIDVKTNTVLYP